MDITKLDKYVGDGVTKTAPLTEEPELIIMEMSELMKIQAKIDKNLKELEKKKAVTTDILVDFKKMSKKLQKAIDTSNRTIKGPSKMNEKMYGFGKNGAVEVFGDTVAITKDGVSIEMTKRELSDILVKVGVAKRR